MNIIRSQSGCVVRIHLVFTCCSCKLYSIHRDTEEFHPFSKWFAIHYVKHRQVADEKQVHVSPSSLAVSVVTHSSLLSNLKAASTQEAYSGQIGLSRGFI